MDQAPRYPIHLHWSQEDGEWVATSPAWPHLSALAETPAEALAGTDTVILMASEANAEAGRPVPEVGKETLAAVKEGLRQTAEGKTCSRGSFARFANDEID